VRSEDTRTRGVRGTRGYKGRGTWEGGDKGGRKREEGGRKREEGGIPSTCTFNFYWAIFEL